MANGQARRKTDVPRDFITTARGRWNKHTRRYNGSEEQQEHTAAADW